MWTAYSVQASSLDDPEPTGDSLCEDPDDEYLIALARSAGALLVSVNRI